jgi:hypothetical protein
MFKGWAWAAGPVVTVGAVSEPLAVVAIAVVVAAGAVVVEATVVATVLAGAVVAAAVVARAAVVAEAVFAGTLVAPGVLVAGLSPHAPRVNKVTSQITARELPRFTFFKDFSPYLLAIFIFCGTGLVSLWDRFKRNVKHFINQPASTYAILVPSSP